MIAGAGGNLVPHHAELAGRLPSPNALLHHYLESSASITFGGHPPRRLIQGARGSFYQKLTDAKKHTPLTRWMPIRLQADADLNQVIVSAVVRRVPAIDFRTAPSAGLARLKDREVLAVAARDGRIPPSGSATSL